MRRLALPAAALALATAASAHEIRPGYLELRETSSGNYELLWKKPAGGAEVRIAPVIPEECRLLGPDRQQITPGSVLVRGTLQCDGGIAGKTLSMAGLETTVTDVLLRVHHADGRIESHLLRPASPAATLGAVTTAGQRAVTYLRLGIEHILLGVDHLLFVLGLLLIVSDRWMLAKTADRSAAKACPRRVVQSFCTDIMLTMSGNSTRAT